MRYERAVRVGAEYRIPMVTDHPAELFANPEVDLIVVATPSFSHFPLAKAALEAGKHVLGVKPPAAPTGPAGGACAPAGRAGGVVAVGHTVVVFPAARHERGP